MDNKKKEKICQQNPLVWEMTGQDLYDSDSVLLFSFEHIYSVLVSFLPRHLFPLISILYDFSHINI